MNAPWTVPAFTPAKFALLALTAIAVTVGVSTRQQRARAAAQGPTLRPIDLVGTDYGTLTATVFLIPTTPSRGSTPPPTPAPIVHRPYPPLAR